MYKDSEEEIKKKIIEIFNFGIVMFPEHIQKRMKERNYNLRDIMYIIRSAPILKLEKEGKDKDRYEVLGTDIEGESSKVVLDIIKNKKLRIVTVI